MIKVDHCISKSVIASTLVCAGSYLYLVCQNPIIGSILLSAILLCVLHNDLNLFTFKSSTLSDTQDLRRLILVLVINIICTLILGLAFKFINCTSEASSYLLYMNELSISEIIIKSIVTGFAFSLAVTSFNRKEHSYLIALLLLFSVTFTHCPHFITDIFYIVISNNWSSVSIGCILLVTVCNFIGSILYNVVINRSIFYSFIE